MEDMDELKDIFREQEVALQSVIAQCDKWIRLAHHKYVDEGKNVTITINIHHDLVINNFFYGPVGAVNNK